MRAWLFGLIMAAVASSADAQEALVPAPAEPEIRVESPVVSETTPSETSVTSDMVATEPTEPSEPELGGAYYGVAKLQGLNKVTARISEIEAPLGVAVHFGALEITVDQCWQSPPDALPENAALLTIREQKPDEAPVTVFHGWMFSSSPSLSGLEHPVYDVTVLDCLKKMLGSEAEEPAEAAAGTAAPEAPKAEETLQPAAAE